MNQIPQEVKDAYKEPHRVYHTTEHIESILEKIPRFVKAYGIGYRNAQLLEIIAWYHDVVYIPGNDKNESDSSAKLNADYASALIKLDDPINFPVSGELNEMCNIIYATKQHRWPPSWLGAIFFDLDLADMGTDRYYENSLKIREEFKEFSDEQWREGRIKFLEDFLSRTFIFHTSLGHNLWELQARENMRAELRYLQEGSDAAYYQEHKDDPAEWGDPVPPAGWGESWGDGFNE